LYKVANISTLIFVCLKTYRAITQTNLIFMYLFHTQILIYVIGLKMYYFQNNRKHTPLIT